MRKARKLCALLGGGWLAVAGCVGTEEYQRPTRATAPIPVTSPIKSGPVLSPLAGPDLSTTPALPVLPSVETHERPLPINLPAALQLADARATAVAAATERIQVAAAVLEQADVLWLPTVTIGGDYNRHDGRQQDTQGNVFDNSRSSTMFGVGTGIGPAAILNVNDALFAPLVARQQVRVREMDRQAASNDTLVMVTDAYFTVQQARGELAGAIEATQRTEQLVARIKELAKDLIPQLEIVRAEAELARRQQTELMVRERWQVASADLLRVLRLDAAAQVEPAEPPHLRVDVIDLNQPVDDLIAIGLTNRPELASQQAQVQATLQMLRQEKLRPLIPSVLLRGYSTPVTGTLAGGVFAGGKNSTIGDASSRVDLDLQVLWQLDNLGFGNRARVHQREAENHLAAIELFRREDLVAAEVAQTYAQARQAAARVAFAEKETRAARESAEKNLLALKATRGADEKFTLVVRPQEAIAAVQSLAQANADYYGAVADANRAQFRLYRALGQPARCLVQEQQVPILTAPHLLPVPPRGPNGSSSTPPPSVPVAPTKTKDELTQGPWLF